MLPACFTNHGYYVASLGNLCRWLATRAEALGVEIYPGFAAAEVLFTEDGQVRGVATGDMGIGKNGEKTARYQPGIDLVAKYTLFAEGARGHLGKRLQERYRLREGVEPQVYGIGLKELWEVAADRHVPGLVVHTAGWPLDSGTYGGSFLYHMENRQVAVGFVVGLGYANPYLSPYEELQRYKTHPAIRGFLEGGRRLAYGARAIAAGGLQSLPKLVFPGGALVGDDAGFLNAARIKGTHAAIKTGMLAAEAAHAALAAGRAHDELTAYPKAFEASWLRTELYRARNFKPWMAKGLHVGTAHGRHRPAVAARQRAVDARPRPCGPRNARAQGCRPADRVSEARRRAHLRSALLGLHLQHHPRGGPAVAPQDQGSGHPRGAQPGRLRRSRVALLSGRGVRVRDRGRHAPATGQCAELRALQDVRHQGSGAEYRVGGPGRRRRPQLSQHVTGRRLEMKTVNELLKSKPTRVVTVPPEMTVLEAIKVLAVENMGAVMVMTGSQLVGILSERDYTRKVILEGRASNTTRVEEIMTSNVVCVSPRTKARECMALMTDKQIRHLPVLDGGRVIGMVSIRDIVSDIIADQDFTIEQLEHYISGQ